MKGAAVLVVLVLWTTPALAQPIAIDRAVSAWSAEHQETAHVWSNVTLWTGVGLSVWDAWQAEDRKEAFTTLGLRAAVAQGVTFAVKRTVHRARPCAPACGSDAPYQSFLSGHMTTSTALMSRQYLAVSLPLTMETGYLRIAANRHHLTDVLAGLAAGLVTQAVIH